MSWFGDFGKFAQFNLSDQWDKVKKNPERPFIGAMDEGSTKVWNKAFDWTAPYTGIHKNYEPMTDYFGGAPQNTYDKAKAKGINTGPFRTGQNVANTITAAYVGGYGAGQLGAGAEGAGGAFTPTEGSSFTIDPSGSYTTAYPSNAAGADVYSGWSPTGSSPSGSPSTLSPSSSNPAAYNDPYAAQDVMQQARDTSAASGSPTSWDAGSAQNGGGMSPFQKQLLAKSLMNMGGKSGYQKPEELKIIKAQEPFAQMGEQLSIQDKKDEASILAEILRNYNG
jgi:hypothetical protein